MSPHPAVRRGLAALALVSLSVLPAAHAAPKFAVAEPSVDFGTVECGRPATARFEIRNDGDALLELTPRLPPEVKLTHADLSLAPQATGLIEVEADTTDLTLEKSRFKLWFKTNDPALKETALELHGLVHFSVVAAPSYLRLSGVPQELRPTTIALTAGDGVPFRVLGLAAKDPFFACEPVTTGAAPRHEFRVQVAADAKSGPLNGWIDVKTDHPHRPRLRLHVSGFLFAAVTAVPPDLDFGEVTGPEPVERKVVLKSFSTVPATFGAPASDSPALEFTLEPHDRRPEATLRVQLRPGAAKGPFTATIRVQTSNPTAPVIEIPVRGKLR